MPAAREPGPLVTLVRCRTVAKVDSIVPQRPVPAGDQGQRPLPDKQAALKCLYLVTRSLDPADTGQARWTMRWKPALNVFAITFSDRFPAAETY